MKYCLQKHLLWSRYNKLTENRGTDLSQEIFEDLLKHETKDEEEWEKFGATLV
jgi:hypothetical protein